MKNKIRYYKCIVLGLVFSIIFCGNVFAIENGSRGKINPAYDYAKDMLT